MKQEKETIDGIKKETSYRNFLGEEIVTLITPRPFPYASSPLFKGKASAVKLYLRLQGSRINDFRLANIRAGITRKGWYPFGYVWHDIYNPYFNTIKAKYYMQLVSVSLHAKTFPHFGAYEQGKALKVSYSRLDATRRVILRRKEETWNRETQKAIQLQRINYNETNSVKFNQLRSLAEQFYPGYLLPESIFHFFDSYVNEQFTPKVFDGKNGQRYMLTTLFPIWGRESLYELIKFERNKGKPIRGILTYADSGNFPFAADGLGNIYFIKLKNTKQTDSEIYFYDHELNCSELICEGLFQMTESWDELIW
nr:hypothetical protein [uncultured Faecalimonas sp.]